MSFGNFKTVAEVARKFHIKVVDGFFVEQKSIQIAELYFSDLTQRLNSSINYVNEFTICETIIRPILDRVAENYTNLNVWSHMPYNVDMDKGLVGEPDYLIAPRSMYGDMERPALGVIEAKQEKFEEGWAQALAEMVASSLLGAEISYSAVTTGSTWEFGRFENSVFTKHPTRLSAASDLQKILDTLNWLFYQADMVRDRAAQTSGE